MQPQAAIWQIQWQPETGWYDWPRLLGNFVIEKSEKCRTDRDGL